MEAEAHTYDNPAMVRHDLGTQGAHTVGPGASMPTQVALGNSVVGENGVKGNLSGKKGVYSVSEELGVEENHETRGKSKVSVFCNQHDDFECYDL